MGPGVREPGVVGPVVLEVGVVGPGVVGHVVVEAGVVGPGVVGLYLLRLEFWGCSCGVWSCGA